MGSLSFLIVEDDPLVASALECLLAQHGSVGTAETLAAARAKMSSNSKYECLIMDLALPDGSGFDFLEQEREALESPRHLESEALDSDPWTARLAST